jgi:hypothetical protein
LENEILTDYKLDIFQTLTAADQQKMDWLEKQPIENQSGFVPLVFMRWMSSINSSADLTEWQILSVNEKINKNFWLLSDYPDLIFKLGCSTGIGKKQKHDWIPIVSNKKNTKQGIVIFG